MARLRSNDQCPCGGESLVACCGRFVNAHALAPSAVELMRSRYTAYVLANEPYLLKTWHPSTRPHAPLELSVTGQKWLGLTIKSASTIDANHASVEFVARYRIAGRATRLHETSRFERLDGAWLYRDGEIHGNGGVAHGR